MKKYLIAAALIVSFSAPTLALGTFYIMFDTEDESMLDDDQHTLGVALQNVGQL